MLLRFYDYDKQSRKMCKKRSKIALKIALVETNMGLTQFYK